MHLHGTEQCPNLFVATVMEIDRNLGTPETAVFRVDIDDVVVTPRSKLDPGPYGSKGRRMS